VEIPAKSAGFEPMKVEVEFQAIVGFLWRGGIIPPLPPIEKRTVALCDRQGGIIFNLADRIFHIQRFILAGNSLEFSLGNFTRKFRRTTLFIQPHTQRMLCVYRGGEFSISG